MSGRVKQSYLLSPCHCNQNRAVQCVLGCVVVSQWWAAQLYHTAFSPRSSKGQGENIMKKGSWDWDKDSILPEHTQHHLWLSPSSGESLLEQMELLCSDTGQCWALLMEAHPATKTLQGKPSAGELTYPDCVSSFTSIQVAAPRFSSGWWVAHAGW